MILGRRDGLVAARIRSCSARACIRAGAIDAYSLWEGLVDPLRFGCRLRWHDQDWAVGESQDPLRRTSDQKRRQGRTALDTEHDPIASMLARRRRDHLLRIAGYGDVFDWQSAEILVRDPFLERAFVLVAFADEMGFAPIR